MDPVPLAPNNTPLNSPPPPPANLGNFQVNPLPPPPPPSLPSYTHSTPPAKSNHLIKWIVFAICLSLITGLGGFFLGLSNGADMIKNFNQIRNSSK